MVNRALFCIFCLLFFYSERGICARDTIPKEVFKKEHFLHFGVTLTKFAVKDFATSPLIYKGILYGGELGLGFQGKHMITLFNAGFSYGYLKNRNYQVNDNNKAVSYNSFVSFRLGHRITKPAAMNLYLGGYLGAIADFRENSKFYNADLNYEVFASLGPMVYWDLKISAPAIPFNFKKGQKRLARNIKFTSSLSFPVIHGVVRPPFNTIEDFVDKQAAKFAWERIDFVSFDKLFSVISQSSINYYLHNGNRIMLSYLWYYYNFYPEINQVRSVGGHFSFSFVFKLNN